MIPLRRIVRVGPRDEPSDIWRLLGLDVSAVVVINGATAKLSANTRCRVREHLDVIVNHANHAGAALLSGGTDAGVFHELGGVAARKGFTGPVVGVVPLGRVIIPEWTHFPAGGHELELHHSHIIAVEAADWGGETATMVALTTDVRSRGRAAVVVLGGGVGARAELRSYRAARLPVCEPLRSGWPSLRLEAWLTTTFLARSDER